MFRKGYVMSADHKAKIAAAHRGVKDPKMAGDLNPAKRPEVRAKLSKAMRKPRPSIRGAANHNYDPDRARKLAETKACECGCGTVIPAWIGGGRSGLRPRRYAGPGHHRRGKSNPDLAEYARKNPYRNQAKGEKHGMWKGGVTPENRKHRQSAAYRTWRDAVYRRDNWTCCDCGKHCQKGDIAAHHILDFWKFPMWRFVVSNGRTTCRTCHARRHRLGIAA